MTNTTLNDRAIIRFSGEDVRGFLQGLVTNDVAGALPVWAGLLTPQGKLLFEFLVWDDGDDLLVDCEAEAADDLVRRLTLYRLRRKLTIERDAALAVHWSRDDEAGTADPRLAALGKRWIAPAGKGEGADRDWRAHRLSLGVAEGRRELGDASLLWLECNAAELNGVSFAKGCYVGQENTARMNWRQKINRRIIVVPIEKADPSRQLACYDDLGWSIEHRRVEAIDPALAPSWMREGLGAAAG